MLLPVLIAVVLL